MGEKSRRAIGVTRYPWWSLGAGLLLGATLAAAVALFGPDGEERLWSGVRLTGRVSFLLFLVPLAARPLDVLIGSAWTRSLLAWRGDFGLAVPSAGSCRRVCTGPLATRSGSKTTTSACQPGSSRPRSAIP